MPICIICNSTDTTREHVIPRWIQRHYDIRDSKLTLCNDTTLPYRNVIVELCKNCNGNVFSRLEQRVQSGEATDQDYYIWALKIRYCLAVKDSNLLLDRSNPLKGTLLEKGLALQGDAFMKHALANFENDKFHFNPNPFGSVFLFDNPLDDDEFGLADVPTPYWGMTIALPQKKILSVLFTDRGLVKRELARRFKIKGGLKKFFSYATSNSTPNTVRMAMLLLMIWQYRLSNIPYGVTLNPNGIKSERIPQRANYKKHMDQSIIHKMAKHLLFDDDFAIEVSKEVFR